LGKVKDSVNKNLLHKKHIFDVRNTKTKKDNKAMQQTLTYFAALHDKPAFAIETSKYLSSTSRKVFYQLRAIEAFMNVMDINFTRDFELTEKNLNKILKDYGTLKVNNNILLPLNNIKSTLSYFPLKSSKNIFKFTHPLGKVKKKFGRYNVYIGNKKILSLKPQYFVLDKSSSDSFEVYIDGKKRSIKKTDEFFVNKSFKIVKEKGVRVNIIGWHKRGVVNESGINIKLKDIIKKFSIDKKGSSFRIEFYKNNKFSSMSIVHFK
jgi:hypothetical protein